MDRQQHISAGKPCGKVCLLCLDLTLCGEGLKFPFDLPGRELQQPPGRSYTCPGGLGDDLPGGIIQAPAISCTAA